MRLAFSISGGLGDEFLTGPSVCTTYLALNFNGSFKILLLLVASVVEEVVPHQHVGCSIQEVKRFLISLTHSLPGKRKSKKRETEMASSPAPLRQLWSILVTEIHTRGSAHAQ